MKIKCSTEGCNCNEFYTTAIVSESWKVDNQGDWLETNEGDGQVVKFPKSDDLFECAECGASADVED